MKSTMLVSQGLEALAVGKAESLEQRPPPAFITFVLTHASDLLNAVTHEIGWFFSAKHIEIADDGLLEMSRSKRWVGVGPARSLRDDVVDDIEAFEVP